MTEQPNPRAVNWGIFEVVHCSADLSGRCSGLGIVKCGVRGFLAD